MILFEWVELKTVLRNAMLGQLRAKSEHLRGNSSKRKKSA
jgi:hypothetical protein